jgi:hypothetical protein
LPGVATNRASTRRYDIRLRGALGETTLSAFPTMRGVVRGAETVLSGVLCDRAALHGVLAQIEALNLDLIEVRSADVVRRPPPSRRTGP